MIRGLPPLIATMALLSGCALPYTPGRGDVAVQVAGRTEIAADPAPLPCADADVPPRVLSEDEAVALALWNNAAFQELLVDLDLARADVITAGQLTNPEFWTVFPVGAKQLEFALNAPLEALWLRPHRLTAAGWQSKRVGDRLVQDGLNLVRDVRVAWADWVLAQDRLRLAEEGAALRQRIADLAQSRLDAGDASELEVSAVRVDALLGRQEAVRLRYDVDVARARLATLLGAPCAVVDFAAIGRDALLATADYREVHLLVCEALRTRPDLLALESAIEAADERARMARYDYLRVIGVLPDANGRGRKGFEAGPGVQFTVPLFHQNQGAIARAEAELAKLDASHDALSDQIVMEVRQSHARLSQAEEDLSAWSGELIPLTDRATEQATRAYEGGGVSLLLVLETTRQTLAARLRRVESAAELRRQAAELERAVGRRLFYPPIDADPAEVVPVPPAVPPEPDVDADEPAELPIRMLEASGRSEIRLRRLEAAVGDPPTETD